MNDGKIVGNVEKAGVVDTSTAFTNKFLICSVPNIKNNEVITRQDSKKTPPATIWSFFCLDCFPLFKSSFSFN